MIIFHVLFLKEEDKAIQCLVFTSFKFILTTGTDPKTFFLVVQILNKRVKSIE